MDITTIIGIVLGFALIINGIALEVTETGIAYEIMNIKNFFDVPSLIIVLGGTIAAIVANYSPKHLKAIPKHMKIMLDGKKGVAEKIVYGAFEKVAEKTGKEPLEAFEEALNNIMPVLEVKARRVGGATYQVPMDIRPERRRTLGLRWLTIYSRKRGEKTMIDRLAGEIMDALNNAGGAVKKKDETHKMAEANKAFSHYKW